MQELREDLILTIGSADNSLSEVENETIRKACQLVVKLTLNKIIERIDLKLLEDEKKQIIEACESAGATDFWVKYESYEQYYNKKYKINDN